MTDSKKFKAEQKVSVLENEVPISIKYAIAAIYVPMPIAMERIAFKGALETFPSMQKNNRET